MMIYNCFHQYEKSMYYRIKIFSYALLFVLVVRAVRKGEDVVILLVKSLVILDSTSVRPMNWIIHSRYVRSPNRITAFAPVMSDHPIGLQHSLLLCQITQEDYSIRSCYVR